MTLRYNDAATVSDEHGKGVEVLRQQVVNIHANGTFHLMVAEVDLIIRNFTVVRHGSGAAGTAQLRKRLPGGTSAVVLTTSITLNANNAPRYVPSEVSLTVASNSVKKGETVELLAGGTHSDFSAHLGWIPDMWGLDADARTYSNPA